MLNDIIFLVNVILHHVDSIDNKLFYYAVESHYVFFFGGLFALYPTFLFASNYHL
jgi:hypothetical protein